ncbi:MAG: hypothetical protein GC179_11230 [Anaerolineaceae bacterium]|nr:hypothetical protein [Anaerolineaceae bacterium]
MQRKRRIAIMITVMLFTSAALLSIFNPQESVVAASASATSTPTKAATATVTSTHSIPLPTSTPSEPDLRNPKFLKDSSLIIKDEKCDAPCWRGITPGETKWNDALNILLGEPELGEPQVVSIPDSGQAVGASWQPIGGEPCCQIISEDGETVASIFLQIAPDITVKQLIDARGEPEYALGTPGSATQAIINMFYPEQSMIVFAFVAGAETGRISENSEIIGVYYTTSDRMDLGIKLSSLYGWKGYQPFSAYAPGAPKPDYKITQSVTLTPSPSVTMRPS